ncbi:hypothetical protein RHS04_06290 [Rhizoctonia solani]|uniref:Uncharacterized protein n=1 Tax=Rhizoctonia solani TaxID=456999 RepID=A0A8H7H458_9AGAM|nr:hypothetical protein RHS04_06290 [Rhizoctonia solani]
MFARQRFQHNFRVFSGVIVKGLGNKSNINAAYKVSVNGNASAAPGTSDLWEAYAPANQAITLYRNMRLGNESQSITLSEIQLAPDSSFCVLRANVSSVNRHEDTPSSPSPTADDSHNSVSKSLSSGKKTDIVWNAFKLDPVSKMWISI